MIDSPLIHGLLNDRYYHVELPGSVTNHAKYAVIALAGLGVPGSDIKAYYDDYSQTKRTPVGFGLEPARSSALEISEANWADFLGKRSDYAAYCEFFDRQIQELGLDEVLRRYMPTLLPAWIGSFTHAGIHLGWGLDANNDCMIAEGLAYLAFSYIFWYPDRSEPVADDGQAVESLLRIAEAWETDDALRNELGALFAGLAPGRAGIVPRISRLLEHGRPMIDQFPSWIYDRDVRGSWDQLHYLVALLYLAKPGNFFILHLVTSLHAMEQISDRLPADQQRSAIKCYWLGMLSILLSGALLPSRSRLAMLDAAYQNAIDPEEADWEQTVARAIAAEEEHNPKMVYVLRGMWRRAGRRTVYRDAAVNFTTTPEPFTSLDMETG